MKITIPAPQNIKRREAFLLTHKDYYPKGRLAQELMRIAMTRAEKKLRWEQPLARMATQEERMKETSKMFTPVKKQGFIKRVASMFKSQRGN